ncbi:class I adenylate-forming enzyme family protein [Auritidibacter ignavus]|uniref:class I adenylate-forming enzyme family protein n=1 Tax=Auritidibacter ignavus TaxID=678932 RepID=UPI002FE57942
MPFVQSVLARAIETPERIALADDQGQYITYGELLSSSRTTASRLQQVGRETPDSPHQDLAGYPVVALCLHDALTTVRLFAELSMGPVVLSVLNPRDWHDQLWGNISSAGITVVVTDDQTFSRYLRTHGFPGTVLGPQLLLAPDVDPKDTTVPQDADPYLVLFSSGTTGQPKAFIKTRGEYRANYRASHQRLQVAGHTTLAPGTLSYSLILYAVVEALGAGETCVVTGRAHFRHMTAAFTHWPITRVVAAPAVLLGILEAAGNQTERLGNLQVLVTGGSAVPQALRDRVAEKVPRAKLINYFGTGEIGFIADSTPDPCGISYSDRLRLYDHVTAQVRDTTNRVLAENCLGQLWFRAPSASARYLNSPAQLSDEFGWRTVGDWGMVQDRWIQLTGRGDEIVTTGANTISLVEADDRLAQALGPLVTGATATVGLPDPRLGVIIAGVIETPQAPTKSELVALARDNIPEPFRPRRWYSIARFPRTSSEKIQRRRLIQLIDEGKAHRL